MSPLSHLIQDARTHMMGFMYTCQLSSMLLVSGLVVFSGCSPAPWNPVHLASQRTSLPASTAAQRCQRPVVVVLNAEGMRREYLAKGDHPLRIRGAQLFATRDLARALSTAFNRASVAPHAQNVPHLAVRVRIVSFGTQQRPSGVAADLGFKQYVASMKWSAQVVWTGQRSETLEYSATALGRVRAISLASSGDMLRGALAEALGGFIRWLRQTPLYARICRAPESQTSAPGPSDQRTAPRKSAPTTP